MQDDFGIALQPDAWQQVSIPLGDLGMVDTYLKEILLSGLEGTFYLDDVALVIPAYRLGEVQVVPVRIKADEIIPLHLTAHLMPTVDPPLSPPAVTVDLTPIGGHPETSMVDDGTKGDEAAGDGIYTVQTTLAPEIATGLKDLTITSIDHRLQATRADLSLLVWPVEDLLIFGDGTGEDWVLKERGGVTLNPTAEALHYQGQSSLELQGEEDQNYNWTVDCVPSTPVDPLGYALRFAFHSGEATLPEEGQFQVAVVREDFASVDLLGSEVESMWVDLGVMDWQVVQIPSSAFRGSGSIMAIRFSGNLEGTFYLDDIRLVAEEPPSSATVVTEEHTASLPQSFILEQNYPNPFNSSTVIRFALPTAEKVELALFNLTGQRVVTLAQGMRNAGTYTVRWDGCGDGGRELASGVYLYRLRVGHQQVETQKLVLMK